VSARVLFIGLDAAEPTLLRRGIADGSLPALRRLASRGASSSLANCMLTLPGAVWPEISSGMSCGKLPRFFHPRQVITGHAAPRPLDAADVRSDPTFWTTAGAQGRRVAVVDIPHAPLADTVNGIQVVEYGLHDSHFGAASHPSSLLDELRRTHGPYTVSSCDHYGGTDATNLALLEDLLRGLERKTALLLDLVTRDRWDLFACAFSEFHCAGHWFWHYSDPGHWGFAPDAPAVLRDAVQTMYVRLDAAVGRLIDAAGAQTTIVLASHGMAPYVAGYQLLPEVLARLGFSSGPAGRGSRLRSAQHAVKNWVPRRHWERLGRLVVETPALRALARPLQRSSGAMFFPLESPRTRAVYVPNNTIGAIRLNMKGREPFGRVEPGAGEQAVIGELRTELLALQHPSKHVPIVDGVDTADELFGAGHHPDVPDLIVRFRQDLGLLDSCESPRVGHVHVPVGSRWGRRSGDHSPRSAVWIQDARLPAGGTLEPGSLLDISPTILAALGCELPDTLDGRPLRAR
jgi:predicted AlkP superfamily phosphohydrolase/phosphomutase